MCLAVPHVYQAFPAPHLSDHQHVSVPHAVIGNFGTVFVDQSYWQSAIAAKPGAAHKGYILGGMVWFTIPFALATALGLAGNALNVALTGADAGAGLVPPASAIALFGSIGGVFVMIQLTMAIVRDAPARHVCVASLWFACHV